jgi:sec-independent protein translocase protein TatA
LIRTFAKNLAQNPDTEYLNPRLPLIRPPIPRVTMGEMLGNIGPLEIIVVLIIALVVFGPKRLPELGSSLGRGIREFKETVTGEKKDDDDDEVKALPATQATATPAAAPDEVETPVATAPIESTGTEAEVAHDKPS